MTNTQTQPTNERPGDEAMKVHIIQFDDHGLCVDHDMPCPVCWKKKAMYQMNTAVFMPCNECQKRGWEIGRKRGLLDTLQGKVTPLDKLINRGAHR